MNTLDPQAHEPENIIACYLIINEEWGMSPGKIASQTFQACQRLLSAADSLPEDDARAEMLDRWRKDGTRTITKFARTRHLFDRAARELDGVLMIDEGLTEGTCGPTVFATWPLRRSELPKVLRHKRISLTSQCGSTDPAVS